MTKKIDRLTTFQNCLDPRFSIIRIGIVSLVNQHNKSKIKNAIVYWNITFHSHDEEPIGHYTKSFEKRVTENPRASLRMYDCSKYSITRAQCLQRTMIGIATEEDKARLKLLFPN